MRYWIGFIFFDRYQTGGPDRVHTAVFKILRYVIDHTKVHSPSASSAVTLAHTQCGVHRETDKDCTERERETDRVTDRQTETVRQAQKLQRDRHRDAERHGQTGTETVERKTDCTETNRQRDCRETDTDCAYRDCRETDRQTDRHRDCIETERLHRDTERDCRDRQIRRPQTDTETA